MKYAMPAEQGLLGSGARAFLVAALLAVTWQIPAIGICAPNMVSTIPDSNNQIIKLTDTGIVPPVLHMQLSDSIVFVLNDTRESLTTVVFEFGSKQMHCAGSNLETTEDGLIRSKRPFAPRDFASTCFHEKGDYKLTAYGLKAQPNGITAHVIVE